MNRPAKVIEAPNPNPVARGSSTSAGITAIEAYIPAPSRNAARLAVQTPRSAIIRMSTSGAGEASSRRTHATRNAPPPANSPTVLGESHPHWPDSVTATSSVESPTAISAADTVLTLAGVRTGEAGTHRATSRPLTTSRPSGSQNSHRQPRPATIGPATTRPSPAPIPNSEDTSPTAPATRSRGSSSRTMPNASGNTAPPTPWSARPASMTASDGASAQTKVPTPSVAITTSSMRCLPCMSPRRPNTGVKTAVASRFALRIQVPLEAPAPSERSMSGSAGTTTDCSSANVVPAIESTASSGFRATSGHRASFG